MPNHVIVSTLGWAAKSLEAAFAGIGDMEMGQAELAIFQAFGDLRPKALADGGRASVDAAALRIRDALAKNSMNRVATIYTGVGDGPLPIAEEIRRMLAVADLAVDLGVGLITTLSSPAGTPFEAAVARLRSITDAVSSRGIQLCMKTHRGLVGEMPGDAVRMCEAIPGLGLTLEASHFYVGANQGEVFWEVVPHVRHVTMRDARGMPAALQMVPGYGEVDFAGIVTRLHERAYDGLFAIEYVDLRPVEGPDYVQRDVISSIIGMRSLFVSLEKQLGVR